jgi:poly(U)-binding-splicing factor PUF60
MTTMAVAAVQALPDLPDLPQAPQTGAVVTGPGGQREQKLFTPAKLTSAQQEAIAKAKKFAMEQSIKSVLLKQTLAHQQQLAQMQSVIQRPFTVMGSMQITDQVWTKLGTVYVGGISFDVREDTVKQAFQPFGPIKNVSLSWDAVANKHKGFAFVEYDLPEAASLSIEQMNNVMLGGRTIKMGRPSNMPQLQPIIERLAEEARPYNRVYVASIHPDLVENDVQSVFEAFGKIRSCKLAPDMLRPGKHRGYGFIEYETPQAANDAIASMNLFNLGGQYLRVGRAVSPPNAVQIPTFPAPMPTAAAVAAAAVTAKISALDAVPGTGLSPLALSSLMNAGIPMTGFAPPGIAIPHLAAPVVASAAAMSMPGVVIPQLAPPGVVTPMLTVQQFGGAGGMATAVSTAGGGLQAATAAAGKLSTSLQLTDAQKRLVEEDAGQTLASQENMQISGSQARQMVMQKLLRNTETRVMVLRNMVGPEDVDEDLESEVVDECSKYGNVNRVIIYQEKQSEADDAEILVKIFVEFHQPSEVEKATKALDNRYFAGRLIRAQPFDQAMFDANDLSG